ncbi:MAG: Fungalysin metallopeptidase, partial [Frankiales bacterium]|nr:Fungalysin metallopeptidase [Frankiales bacterium]
MKDLSACNYVYRSGFADDGTATSGPSPLDYDADPVTGLVGAATLGNNAVTTNAQESSSLTPGAPGTPVVDPTRNYAPAFTDSWHTSKCDPTTIAGPTGADVNAAIVNLFVGHNRIHDFSYRLGLTEKRGAMQVNNFGVTGTNVAEDDPELGNAQNAALSDLALRETSGVTGPAAGVGLTGRDNANQITLQDGVPGITNQYLFQPVVGFYSPCTDGDLDASVFLHEYTHAISNRLIAGPATGLSGQQGGSMGESWSDLDAIEYLNAFGLAGSRGEDPFALGAYATGDAKVGIRDFNLAPSKNPLNYSDFGFDTTGPEVHADGEVWNAVQMTIREALIKKYDATYPHTDKVLQKACALGRNANGTAHSSFAGCPGNRRYITYMYDALILQANGAPSMVDMKNAELAAVMMRAPADYDTVAEAFASRGLGSGASSKTSDDTAPVPSFAAPKAAKNSHVTFKLVDATTGKPVKASVFIGRFTARCRPIATTLGGKELPAKAEVLAGTYTLSVQGKGYGIQRFQQAFKAGTQTVTLRLAKNLASSAYGPAISASAGAHRIGGINDDSEVTNGGFDGKVKGSTFTVKLGGGMQTFDRVAVSSLHHPALPAAGEEPAEFEGRLLGIHDFQIQASSNGGKSFTTVYTSPKDFFPTKAPRATAGMLVIREAKLAKPVRANAVRIVVLSNTCTGTPQFHTEQEN